MRRDLGIILIEAAVGGVLALIPMMFESIEAGLGYWIIAGLVMVCVLGVLLLFWPAKEESPEEEGKMGDDNRIQIGNISGGKNRIGHEIHNHRPAQRRMTETTKAEFLAGLPNDRPVRVLGMNGNTESMAYASEIHQFLAQSGYQMADIRASEHTYFSPPVHTVNINSFDNGAEWQLVVGPAE